MSVGDVFLLVVRWLHLISATTWVGGSLFYLLVLRPAQRRNPDSPRGLTSAIATEFRALVNTSIVVLIATGVILAFDRLSEGTVETPYVITLGIKVALSIWMFLLVGAERRRISYMEAYLQAPRPAATGLRRIGGAFSDYNTLIILGIVIFFLSDLLKVLFEMALSRP